MYSDSSIHDRIDDEDDVGKREDKDLVIFQVFVSDGISVEDEVTVNYKIEENRKSSKILEKVLLY